MPHSSQKRDKVLLILWSLLLLSLTPVLGHAQYRGNHITGFVGLQAGTQAPPGLYVGNVVWNFPTSTIKNDNGDKINPGGGTLTSTADVLLVSWVTNLKLAGANVGVQAAIPFIKNRIQLNVLDVDTGLAFTDSFFSPLILGWHFKRADVTAGYNLYVPTGRFAPGASDNTGLGMYGNEFTLGTTAYLDEKRMWHAAANFSMEFHTKKDATDITVGDLGTVEGGFGRSFHKKGRGPIPTIFNVGVAGYSQFKITGDNGSDIPVPLRGFKDRVFALGPEFNVFIPQARLTLLARYLPEFGARTRTQGQTFVFSVVWVAKSLVKHQP
jgi:hypothetical protein